MNDKDPLGLFPEDNDPLGLFKDEPHKYQTFKVKGIDGKDAEVRTGLPSNLDEGLGLVETLTTGGIDAIGSVLGGLGGAIAGAVHPNGTLADGFQRGQEIWHDSAVGKTLAPQAKTGKRMADDFGGLVNEFKEFAPQNAYNLVSGIPFVGPKLNEENPELARGIAAVSTALPEIASVAPLAGVKGGKSLKGKEGVSAPSAKEAFDRATQQPDAHVQEYTRAKAALDADQTAHVKTREDWVQNEWDKIDRGERTPFNEYDRLQEAQRAVDERNAALNKEVELAADPIRLQRIRDELLQRQAAERAAQENASAGTDKWLAENAARMEELKTQLDSFDKQVNDFNSELAQAKAQRAVNLHNGELYRSVADNVQRTRFEEQVKSIQDKVEAEKERVAQHPMVQAALKRVTDAFEVLNKEVEAGGQHVERLKRDVEMLDDKLDQVIENVKRGQEGITEMNGGIGVKPPKELEEYLANLGLTAKVTKHQPTTAEMKLRNLLKEDASTHTSSVFKTKQFQPEYRPKEGWASQAHLWDESYNEQMREQFHKDGIDYLWAGMGMPGPRPPRGDSITAPTSPEMIARKAKAAAIAARYPGKERALDEFNTIKTPEEVKALAPEAKDIPPNWGQRLLGSGARFQAIMSNNPLLKYLNTLSTDIRAAANAFSEKYITGDSGLNTTWRKMSKDQRMDVIDALMEGDRRETPLTPEIMDTMGFNDAQRKFVQTFYDANDAMYKRWNEVREALGYKPIEYRRGHVPGIFSGSYTALVMEGDKTVGVISADTTAQLKLAKEYVEKNMENVKFIDAPRRGLASSANKYYSNVFSGMSDVLEMLGREDPRFAEVQELVSKAINDANNKLFNFNVHQLHKKGVFGNEGNKPWLNRAENTEQAYKSFIRYFEEGSMHHELQVPLRDLTDLLKSPELENMPNARRFTEEYMSKMTGRDIGQVGAGMNMIIDGAMHLVPHYTYSKGNWKLGIGVGPKAVLNVTGSMKNFMSQYYMGWGNYMFTAAQLMQPAQTGLPFMQLAASRLGVSPLEIGKSMGYAGAQFAGALAERITGKQITEPVMRRAFEYANERGLMTFSEMEKAYSGTQKEWARVKDKLAEANMQVGELMTRTPMFMAFTDLLTKGGIDVERALPIAENLTQFAMIDYHQWERPMLYGKLGVMGQFAGGLTTFKHGYMSQQMKLGKEALSPTKLLTDSGDFAKANRSIAPWMLSALLSTMVFSGITGTPFYQELDQIYSKITNAVGGKARSIRQDFLEHFPEWLNTGALSNAIGLNMQGKFSSADMIPDSIPRAMSPQLEGMYNMGKSAVEYAQNPDHVRARNLATDATPSAWKGAVENIMRTDEEKEHGFPINREGLKVGTMPRTDAEWKLRAATGLRPQDEAVDREELWNLRKSASKDTERMREIAKLYKQMVISGDHTREDYRKLQKEYMERGGDVQTLINLAIEAKKEKPLNEKQRLEGIPNGSIGSINRYKRYNE